jgi:PPOX class probable F420-dependent enzyme
MIDLTTKLGAQAAQRLQQDYIIWLTTVSRDGTPQPNPVWFYWDGKSILIYTQPTSHKLKNISRNPRVSVNFQANDEGDDVIVLTGDASIDKNPHLMTPDTLRSTARTFLKLGSRLKAWPPRTAP